MGCLSKDLPWLGCYRSYDAPALLPKVGWRINRTGLSSPRALWLGREKGQWDQETHSCICVTLARELDLSVLPFLTQQMGPVCPTLPNTKSSRKSRPKARGVVGWAWRNGGGPLQEVSVGWEAHPASTLGKDSTEGTMEQLAWLPQASGLSGSAVSLIRETVPALPGMSPISQPPPKS